MERSRLGIGLGWLVVVGGAVVVTGAGCGGSDSPLYVGGGDGGGGGTDATTGGDTGAGTDSGGGGDGAAGIDASTPADAAGPPLVDGAVVADGGADPDTGPGGNATQIPCGNATCAIPAEICCVYTMANPPPDRTYVCVVGTTCPTPPRDSGVDGVTGLTCTATANCPAATVCCVGTNGGTTTSTCKAACGPNEGQLCDPTAVPTGCPQGVQCSSNNIGDWGLTPPFATCGGKGN